jgi:hypothetical protein
LNLNAHKSIPNLKDFQETGKVLPNRNEIGGGARTARTARTLANEEAILNIVEEDNYKEYKRNYRRVGYLQDILSTIRLPDIVFSPRGGSAQLSVGVFKIPSVLVCNIAH